MIYLDDYLESIEHLPQEIWERFTEMRELDLQSQLVKDSQRKKLKDFFIRAPSMPRHEREKEFRVLRAGYDDALACAGGKTQIAQTMYDTVDRYLRKLDAELQKLKTELEADSPGITETLEQRALEAENRENRELKATKTLGREGEKKAIGESIANVLEGALGPSPNYGLGQIIGAGGPLAAAASQAIAATQQMQQGRRSASLKASYEAISGLQDFDVENALPTPVAAQELGRKKRKTHHVSVVQKETPSSPSAPSSEMCSSLLGADGVFPDWAIDPNEPRYCTCNQVSYGDMVACDNEECPYEWFHYACVGMTDAPKGKWYCPRCTASMKRRGTKK